MLFALQITLFVNYDQAFYACFLKHCLTASTQKSLRGLNHTHTSILPNLNGAHRKMTYAAAYLNIRSTSDVNIDVTSGQTQVSLHLLFCIFKTSALHLFDHNL